MAATLSMSAAMVRPAAPAVASTKRSAFAAGGAVVAAPRAASGALLTARARKTFAVEARATKGSAAGQQVTVDVEKPLGLVGAAQRRGETRAGGTRGRGALCFRRCVVQLPLGIAWLLPVRY